MHTVIETRPYLADAAMAGMSEAERERAVVFLAENPEAGDLVRETGGCRKIRIAKDGKRQKQRLSGDHLVRWRGYSGVLAVGLRKGTES
jgi:hypothetical protein